MLTRSAPSSEVACRLIRQRSGAPATVGPPPASWDHRSVPRRIIADEIPPYHDPRPRSGRHLALLLRRPGPAGDPAHGEREGSLHAGVSGGGRDAQRRNRSEEHTSEL